MQGVINRGYNMVHVYHVSCCIHNNNNGIVVVVRLCSLIRATDCE